jgi:hypothetical protein
MYTRILKVVLAIGAIGVVGSTSHAYEPEGDEEVVCQEYGGWPEVGGSIVCVTSSGQICRFKSVKDGVEGGCEAA